jgi:hypothetical protein
MTVAELPDALNRSVAVMIFALAIGMVAVHTAVAALAAQRRTFGPRKPILLAGLVGVYLTLWLGFAVTVGDRTGLAIARQRPHAIKWATAWNVFGLLDLIVAPAAAVLSQAQVIGLYPLSLFPLFIGPPLGILMHVYSLRNLAMLSSAAVVEASGQSLTAERRGVKIESAVRT